MLSALVFDFDGTVLDTEAPEFRSWQEIYADHGAELPLAEWAAVVGGSGEGFDPYGLLERLIGESVDKAAIRAKRRPRHAQLIEQEVPRPGVLAAMDAARSRGMKLAVASSSHLDWVAHHLERLNLRHAFDTICTADDVERVKPDPALYALAVERLGVAPQEALAVEDSRNGMLAAKRAGLHCIVVPNSVTQHSDFAEADIVLKSLDDVPLSEICNQISRST